MKKKSQIHYICRNDYCPVKLKYRSAVLAAILMISLLSSTMISNEANALSLIDITNNYTIEVLLNRNDIEYDLGPLDNLVEKGFITVDGVSLTVVTMDASSFQVSVVDYTRKHTTLGSKRVGSMVNLEVDIIAKYVEQYSQTGSPGITVGFLQEHGFIVS